MNNTGLSVEQIIEKSGIPIETINIILKKR